MKRWDHRIRTSQEIYHVSYAKRVAAETETERSRQHNTHKKKTGWRKRCPIRNRGNPTSITSASSPVFATPAAGRGSTGKKEDATRATTGVALLGQNVSGRTGVSTDETAQYRWNFHCFFLQYVSQTPYWVFAIYQNRLGWKTHTYIYIYIIMKPANSPTQGQPNREKVG